MRQNYLILLLSMLPLSLVHKSCGQAADPDTLYVKAHYFSGNKDTFCYVYTDKFDNVMIPDLGKHKLLSTKDGFKQAYQFSCGLARVLDFNGHWKYIDKEGNVVFDASGYDFCWSFEENARLSGGGIPNHAVINKGYKIDDSAGGTNEEGNGKYGIINKDGQVVLPVEYDVIEGWCMPQLPYDKIWWIKKDGLYGAIDENVNLIIPVKFRYEEIFLFSEGIALVKKDNLWGIIDKKGKEIVPFEYSKAVGFSNSKTSGGILANKNGFWGIITRKGAVLQPFKYKKHEFLEDNVIQLYDENNNKILWNIPVD